MPTFDIRRDDALTVADLNTDIDRLLQVAESFNGDSASAMLREVPSLVAKLDCLRLLLVSRINQSGIWRDDPNGTLESFLRRLDGRDHRESKRDTRAAEFLNRNPAA